MYAPEICFNVSVNTSPVNHSPLVKLSLKLPYFLIAASAPVPITSEVLINASWNNLPPIPPLTTEFQSCKETLPAAKACDNWYITVDAWADDEPDAAAKLAIPFIAAVEVSKSTPAAVNVPIFLVISAKLYIVLSA